jgi:hypothetical protein
MGFNGRHNKTKIKVRTSGRSCAREIDDGAMCDEIRRRREDCEFDKEKDQRA